MTLDVRPDPARCPDCGGAIAGEPACPACGLALRGPAAAQLWQVTTELARLAAVRAHLLDALRPSERRGGDPAAGPAPTGRGTATDVAAGPPGAASESGAAPAPRRDAWPGPAPGAWPAASPRPRREWTADRVQNLLLAIGVLLLMVTGVVFTAFTSGRVPLRAAVMAALTVFTGYLADRVLRRGLTASAEAIGLLAVLLAAIDAYAARRAGLAGLDGTDPGAYWSVASGVLALAAAGFSRLVPVRSARYAALLGAQLPLAITAARMPWTPAGRGALYVTQAAVLVLVAGRLRSLAGPARAFAAANWAIAAALGFFAGYGTTVRPHVHAGSLLLLAVGAVALLWDPAPLAVFTTRMGLAPPAPPPGSPPAPGHLATGAAPAAAPPGPAATAAAAAASPGPPGPATGPPQVARWWAGAAPPDRRAPWDPARERAYVTGVATLAFVGAALAPPHLDLPRVQLPAAVAATGFLVVVAAALLPRPWRSGPVTVGAGTVAFALAGALPHAGQALALPFTWAANPWGLSGDPPARAAFHDTGPWHGTVVTLGVVAVATVALLVAADALDRRRAALPYAAALAALTVVLVPLGFAWSYRTAVGWDVAAGLAGLTAAVALRRAVVAVPATVALAVATGWSLADRDATLVVLLVVTVAYAAYAALDATVREAAAGVAAAAAVGFAAAVAAARGAPADRTGFVVATAAFSLVGAAALLRPPRTRAAVEGVAGAAYVVGLGLGAPDAGWLSWALGGGAVTAALRSLRDRGTAPLAAALGIACAGTTATAYGAPLDRAAFVVALASAAAVGAGYLLRDDLVEVAGGAGYAVALTLAASDPGWLSWVLATGGLTALADALRPERRSLGWVATALLTAWSWDRLWLADVRVPEAYAAPVAALALGLGHLRRRREPGTGSWQAYGFGLTAAFGSTTALVLTDPGVTRPVALAVAGVTVLLAGVRERLQAPLTVGAVALAVDAVVQLAPVAVALPKWATIGTVGLLVIGVGVTYEDRRRDAARLRASFERLD